jgi:hypothetical protein
MEGTAGFLHTLEAQARALTKLGHAYPIRFWPTWKPLPRMASANICFRLERAAKAEPQMKRAMANLVGVHASIEQHLSGRSISSAS